jgi:hypothetical protein
MHGTIGLPELVLVVSLFVGTALLVWPCWRILKKAGLEPTLSLIALIPFGVFVVLLILAFAQWPTLTRT